MKTLTLTGLTILLAGIYFVRCNSHHTPTAKSWNPAVVGTPRVVTVGQIHDGKTFEKLNGRGDASCCPPDAWKRALPNKWMAQYPSYFVQVNKLQVLQVDPQGGDDCTQTGKTFQDRHVVVRAADDVTGPQFVVEFDRCWCANNLLDCTAFPRAGQIIDVQGFVTWDPPAATTMQAPDLRPAGEVSNWEIHPISAWRMSDKE